MTLHTPVLETNVPGLKLRGRGKVRDIYEDPRHPERLLIVATDRISAFDYILASGIPEKGRVLTQMSLFWFDLLRDTVPNHLLSTDMTGLPAELEGRSMWVKRADMFDVECVARGYLSGSGWKEYQQTGAVCGIKLPPGLRESDALPEPIFTPATKAQTGHDENISFERMVSLVGADLSARLRDLTLKIYRQAAEYARPRGIILADTKFEFGLVGGEMTLADRMHMVALAFIFGTLLLSALCLKLEVSRRRELAYKIDRIAVVVLPLLFYGWAAWLIAHNVR